MAELIVDEAQNSFSTRRRRASSRVLVNVSETNIPYGYPDVKYFPLFKIMQMLTILSCQYLFNIIILSYDTLSVIIIHGLDHEVKLSKPHLKLRDK